MSKGDSSAENLEKAKPSVLVFGARGWIGKQFVDLVHARGIDVHGAVTRVGRDSDAMVEAEIVRMAPTHVFSLLGRTWGPGCGTIDYLEGGSPERLRDNVGDNLGAPVTLAIICARHGIHFTYLGTGCIFKYDEAHPMPSHDAGSALEADQTGSLAGFTEDDDANFFGSSYSVVKGITDRILRNMAKDGHVLVARIRMPVGDERSHRDFATKIATYDHVVDIPNSLTVLHTLLPCLLQFALDQRVGTINLVNPGPVSHLAVLRMYRDEVDATHVPKVFSVEEQAAVIKGDRSNCALSTDKLREWCPSVPSAIEATRDALCRQAAAMPAVPAAPAGAASKV